MENLIVTQVFEDPALPASPVLVTVKDEHGNEILVGDIDLDVNQPPGEDARVVELTLKSAGSCPFNCAGDVWNPNPAQNQNGEDVVFHVYENLAGGGRTKRGASQSPILAHTSATGGN